MTSRRHKTHKPEFKAKVALEAIRGDENSRRTGQPPSGVSHPNQCLEITGIGFAARWIPEKLSKQTGQ